MIAKRAIILHSISPMVAWSVTCLYEDARFDTVSYYSCWDVALRFALMRVGLAEVPAWPIK